MCELLVGLPDVIVLGVVDEVDGPLRVHVEIRDERRTCGGCGAAGRVKERPEVKLVDLPVFGRQARLVWHKHRLVCIASACAVVSWTVEVPAIASPRLALSDRAGRWVTKQVGGCGRTVNEVALELGCDWHTVNDAVIAYGTALVDDPARIGEPTALTRPCSVVKDRGANSAGRRRSSMSASDASSTSSLAAAVLSRAGGWPPGATNGGHASPGRLSTCRGRIELCSTRCCPTPPRSLTHSM
jgi:hypothetical protein